MKNICVFSVLHYVEGASDAISRGTPELRNGAPRDELKNGRGSVWAVACFFEKPLLGKPDLAPSWVASAELDGVGCAELFLVAT